MGKMSLHRQYGGDKNISFILCNIFLIIRTLFDLGNAEGF